MYPDYWESAKEALCAKDSILSQLVSRCGDTTQLKSLASPCLTLAKAIVGQQISTVAADAIWKRLLAVCNGTITPKALLVSNADILRRTGLSQRKVDYLQGMATAMQGSDYTFEALQQLDDQQVTHHLCQLHGIGPWSAEMMLIFCLMRPNVLPVTDVGLQRAVLQHYCADYPTEMTRRQTMDYIRKLSLQWQPFCTVATWYLWRSMDDEIVQY